MRELLSTSGCGVKLKQLLSTSARCELDADMVARPSAVGPDRASRETGGLANAKTEYVPADSLFSRLV